MTLMLWPAEDVCTEDEIEAQFDGISYEKGASVLRMLRAYLTRDANPSPLLRRRGRSLAQVGMETTPAARHRAKLAATCPSSLRITHVYSCIELVT